MATVRLTDRLIRNLKTDKTQEDFYDENFSGGSFAVRVSKHGRRSFVLFYRVNGRKRRMTLGVYPVLGLADARARARQIIGDVSRGQDPAGVSQSETRTFADLAELYLECHARVNKKASSCREDERILGTYLLPVWASRKVTDITRPEIIQLLDAIAFKRQAPVMANRVKALLHTIFRFAIRKAYVPDDFLNPCVEIGPLVDEQSRDRVLTDGEVRTLWKELSARKEPTASIYRLILLTAQRPGEVRQMRWEYVEGDLWTIPAAIVKNGRQHLVPLSSQALEILEQLRPLTGRSEWVFPSSTGGSIRWLQKTSQRLHQKVGFHFRPHDLRRTAATGMGRLGVDEIIIARVLNHSWVDRNMTAVYNRLPEMYDALSTWGHRVEVITKVTSQGLEDRLQ